MAPLAAIDAVEAATKLPFDEGVEAERKLFTECLFSDQSKAMIHVFFGEREVAKIPDVPKETPTIPVNSAAVIGAGTMGGGIAMNYANAGIPVLLQAKPTRPRSIAGWTPSARTTPTQSRRAASPSSRWTNAWR